MLDPLKGKAATQTAILLGVHMDRFSRVVRDKWKRGFHTTFRRVTPPLAPPHISAKNDPILQDDDLRILKSHLKPKAEKPTRRRPRKPSELIAEARAARMTNPYR